MEETIEQKKRRLYGKQFLKNYQKTISEILYKCDDDSYEILSIMESDVIFNQLNKLKLVNSSTFTFKEKITIWNLFKNKFSNKFYLITSLSYDCGVFEVKNIDCFNIDFDYSVEPTGLIILVNSTLEYKLVLDFYEEEESLKIDMMEYM